MVISLMLVKTLIENLDVTILSTAIPSIANEVKQDPLHLQVALSNYFIGLAIFTPISGWLADKFGARNIFILGSIILGLGSSLCSTSESLMELAIWRFIQGAGGSITSPVATIILIKSYPKSQLAKVSAFTMVPAIIGPIIGPILGAFIVTYASWRYIFYVNIPLVIIGCLFAYKFIDNYKVKELRHFDVFGFTIFGLGLAGFNFAIDCLSRLPIYRSLFSMILLISSCLIGIFIKQSYAGQMSLLKVSLFKINAFHYANMGCFASRTCMGGVIFVIGLLLQIKFNFSPITSGTLMIAYALGIVTTKLIINDIVFKFGYKTTLFFNTIATGFSIISFTLLSADSSHFFIAALLFIHGHLSSTQFSCLNVLAYLDITKSNVSDASNIVCTVQQISMGMSLAFATIMLKVISLYFDKAAYTMTFSILGICTIFSSLIFLKLNDKYGYRKITNK
jgi:EmrB/QacA subfamily drug resistance transporter